jgi:hypothetical protein
MLIIIFFNILYISIKNTFKNIFFSQMPSLILANKSSSKPSTRTDAIGKSVMLEQFDHPGMLVVYQETDGNLNLQVAEHDHFLLGCGIGFKYSVSLGG